MWNAHWRDEVWGQLSHPWDVIVIGGGITGAGILREASRMGLRAVLFEARDFASGTSSRSSKLVHGGLRYLKNAQLRMTYESVRERERLLREGRGLVTPLSFLFANYTGDHPPAWMFGAGLILYDMLALRWRHKHYAPQDLLGLCPPLNAGDLVGGYRYVDAQVDDARLVLRLIREGVQGGGLALNYAPVVSLVTDARKQVAGVVVRDDAIGLETTGGQGRTVEVAAPVVINATGVWADELRRGLGPATVRRGRQLRRLRGSHVVYPWRSLPLLRAVSFLHPRDDRPVFCLPWEGATIIGTTDVEHTGSMDQEPSIDAAEAEYLLEAARFGFPSLELGPAAVQATFAGVRPVLHTGQANPSEESREHVLWNEMGLLTVTGGKLTTFRLMAHAALQAVQRRLPYRPVKYRWARHPALDRPAGMTASPGGEDADDAAAEAVRQLPVPTMRRLAGRYGREVSSVLAAGGPGELRPLVEGLPVTWGEARFAARAEGVVHLDDLMLRRVRLGLTAPGGAIDCLPELRRIAQPELGWSDARWEQEAARYREIWLRTYSPSAGMR